MFGVWRLAVGVVCRAHSGILRRIARFDCSSNGWMLIFTVRIRRRVRNLAYVIALVFTGSVNTRPYVYRYLPGRTATLDNGYAVAPPAAPFSVREAIDAGNE